MLLGSFLIVAAAAWRGHQHVDRARVDGGGTRLPKRSSTRCQGPSNAGSWRFTCGAARSPWLSLLHRAPFSAPSLVGPSATRLVIRRRPTRRSAQCRWRGAGWQHRPRHPGSSRGPSRQPMTGCPTGPRKCVRPPMRRAKRLDARRIRRDVSATRGHHPYHTHGSRSRANTSWMCGCRSHPCLRAFGSTMYAARIRRVSGA